MNDRTTLTPEEYARLTSPQYRAAVRALKARLGPVVARIQARLDAEDARQEGDDDTDAA